VVNEYQLVLDYSHASLAHSHVMLWTKPLLGDRPFAVAGPVASLGGIGREGRTAPGDTIQVGDTQIKLIN